jgi:hypothetical protein
VANEPNATPPAVDPPADVLAKTGDVLMRTRPGYNLVDDNMDLDMKDGEVYKVSAADARKIMTKHPDYVQVAEVPDEEEL